MVWKSVAISEDSGRGMYKLVSAVGYKRDLLHHNNISTYPKKKKER